MDPQSEPPKINNSNKQLKESVEAKKDIKPVKSGSVGFLALFRFATPFERFVAALAVLCGVTHGGLLPVNAILFGRIANDFTPDKTDDEILAAGRRTSIIMFLFGFVTMAFAGVGIFLWNYIGTKVTARVKRNYFRKVLDQDITWFDLENPEKLTSEYNHQMSSFRRGIG